MSSQTGSSSLPPSTTPTSPGQGPGPPSSASTSNLYLVTFLATLFLLLFISCAIILRSYILRRRYQRHVHSALGAGMLLTPRSPGSRYSRFGHMPKLFDSWLVDGGGGKWKDMSPLAAQPVFVKKKRKDSILLKSPETGSPAELSNTHSNHAFQSVWSRFKRDTASAPPNASEDTEPLEPLPSASTLKNNRVEMLQISVLIAMPSQSRTLRKNAIVDSTVPEDDDDAPLPELVLGITRIPYRHKPLDPNPLPSPSSPSDIRQ